MVTKMYERVPQLCGLFFCILCSLLCEVIPSLTGSSVGNVSISSQEVYYVHIIIVNVYREDVIVLTTLEGDPRLETVTIPKGTRYEIKTKIPVSTQGDPRVSLIAFDKLHKSVKIDGLISKSIYLNRLPTKAPHVFYIEKRPTIMSSFVYAAKATSNTEVRLTSSETLPVSSRNLLPSPTSAVLSKATFTVQDRLTKATLPEAIPKKTTQMSTWPTSFKDVPPSDAVPTNPPFVKVPSVKFSFTKGSSTQMLAIAPSKSLFYSKLQTHGVLVKNTYSTDAYVTNTTPTEVASKENSSAIYPAGAGSFTALRSTDIVQGRVSSAQVPSIALPITKVLSNRTLLTRTSSTTSTSIIKSTFLGTESKTNMPTIPSNFKSSSRIPQTPTIKYNPVISSAVPINYSRSSCFTATEVIPRTVVVGTDPTHLPSISPSDFCPQINDSTAWGIFVWPDTKVNTSAAASCPYDRRATATRRCGYIKSTTQILWESTNAKDCPYLTKTSLEIFHLSMLPVNASNGRVVAREINELLSVRGTLVPEDVSNTATVLENIVAVQDITNEVSESVLNTIDNILNAKMDIIVKSQRMTNSSSRILQTLTNHLNNINISGDGSFEKSLKNFAVGVSFVPILSFNGLMFSAFTTRDTKALDNEVISTTLSHKYKRPSSANATSIYLPHTIFRETTTANISLFQTISFVVYKQATFFRTSLVNSPDSFGRHLNSYVISADIKGYSIFNLSNQVELTFPRLNVTENSKFKPVCVFWNYTQAQWSREGCSFQGFGEDGRIVCHCNHLTNFAMLMDINLDEEISHNTVLSKISYIGCSLSLLGMALTISTILLFRDLRRTVPLQILLNFCVALSFTLIVFLAAVERSRTTSVATCRVGAIALHYFSLAVFMWMAILAFNMYRLFVKVLASYVSRFVFKCCVVAWGIPAVIVSITVGLALDKYGDSKYCRLTGLPFIVAFFTPVVIILAGNVITFVLIFRSLCASSKVSSSQKRNGFHQARQGAAILVLLGLTWLFGAFAVRDANLVFQYLFCIFNSLQGLLVFIFYCVVPSTTREKYKNLFKTKRSSSPFGDESGRAMLNMDTTDTYKTTTIGRNDNAKNPILLTHLKQRSPELLRLTDTFGHQTETEM